MHGEDINSSYLFGNDTENVWGPRYFFTFYSEFGPRDESVGIETALLVLTFVASLAANLSIIAAVVRYRELRTVTNCFLLNLAAADLVFALGIPLVATTRVTQKWILGDIPCRILPYTQFVCGSVLLWTLTLISMDRHQCIVVPPYRSRLTPKLTMALTSATWIIAAVLFLPVAFWFHEQRSLDDVTICTLVFPKSDTINVSLCFTVPVLLFACLLPMGLLVFHYQRIFRKLLSTRNRWAVPCVVVNNPINGKCGETDTPSLRRDSELSFVSSLMIPWTRKASSASQQYMAYGRNGSMSQHEELRLNKHLRVVRVLLLNVIVVLLMWLPITVVMFLIYLDGKRPNDDTGFFLRSCHFLWALMIALLNTVVNPVLYGVLSENFRSCFGRWCCGVKRTSRNGTIRANQNKSNNDVLQDGGNNSNRSAGTRTPSSGRVSTGQQQQAIISSKNYKKNSTCSVASILEVPSQFPV